MPNKVVRRVLLGLLIAMCINGLALVPGSALERVAGTVLGEVLSAVRKIIAWLTVGF